MGNCKQPFVLTMHFKDMKSLSVVHRDYISGGPRGLREAIAAELGKSSLPSEPAATTQTSTGSALPVPTQGGAKGELYSLVQPVGQGQTDNTVKEVEEASAFTNILPPFQLDIAQWRESKPLQAMYRNKGKSSSSSSSSQNHGTLAAVININMIHISPYACTEGLFACAAEVLRPGGFLFCYGPYNKDGG